MCDLLGNFESFVVMRPGTFVISDIGIKLRIRAIWVIFPISRLLLKIFRLNPPQVIKYLCSSFGFEIIAPTNSKNAN